MIPRGKKPKGAADTLSTKTQVSAGGVVFRHVDGRVEIAVISVGAQRRWQLPKGLVDAGELPEQAAAREVREEAGIEGELVAPLEIIEYWYVAAEGEQRARIHKFVHFYLLAFRAGDVREHDHEVNEARWVSLEEAQALLAFASERRVVVQAETLIATSKGA